MFEYNEQCKKCFHFQVCAQVMKNQLFIREKMLKEENPKCEHFVNAADVAEVRHARWNNGSCTNCGYKTEIENIGFNCSGTASVVHYKHTNYCPNCGAKMDGKSGDEV